MPSFFKQHSIRESILFPTILIIVFSLLIVSSITFLNYQNTTSEIVQDSSKEINKQIILNFENYIASVIDTADYIQEKTIEYGLRNQNDRLDEIFIQAAEVQPDIESIVLIDIWGSEIVSSSSLQLNQGDLTQKEWYLDAFRNSEIYHFSSPHIQDIFDSSNAEVLTVTKVIDYYENNVKYNGILVVDINTSSIKTLSETTNLGEGGHLVILNDDDSLVFTSNDYCDDEMCESIDIAKDLFGGEAVQIDGINMYANVNTLMATRWRMASFINIEIVRQTEQRNLLILVFLLLSTIIVTGIVSNYISRRISSPISKLKDHMLKIEQGNFYEEVEIDGQKEVVLLAHGFNSMITETRHLMNRLVEEQVAKRKTEFQALQNQINPHFLYNTLDSIVYLAENNQNSQVVEMVVALSRFFRISISRGKNIILLKEEIEHARNYLLIQQIRYNDKFDFEFDIAPGIENHSIVKLSLQPLIENAIYHGINTEYSKGKIIIRALKRDGTMILEVEDDGYGIPDEQIQELYDNVCTEQPKKSVGLRNVYQRLRIYYGDNVQFEVESILDEKTIVRLLIPLEEDHQ